MNEITAPTLRRLMENDETLHNLRVTPHYASDPGNAYYKQSQVSDIFPRGNIGWKNAGEIIGSNTTLTALMVGGAPGIHNEDSGEDRYRHLQLFFNGVGRNVSLTTLAFVGWNVLGGAVLPLMQPLIENNSNLTDLSLIRCPIGDDGVRLLASALSSCTHNVLEVIKLPNCAIEGDGESFEQLASVLNESTSLSVLDLRQNDVGNAGCVSLASMLSNPHSEMKVLHLQHNNVGNEGVTALAEALSNNNTLTKLDIAQGNSSINNSGWEKLTQVLCNTKTIKCTFLSNHTLLSLGQERVGRLKLPRNLQSYLDLNKKYQSTGFPCIQKILGNHENWDMASLIDEELQYLPYILAWMDKAETINHTVDGNVSATRRQTSRTLKRRRIWTIHQFVAFMPVTVIDKIRMSRKK